MFGLTTTRRLRTELADARAETDRQRTRAETAEGRAATAEFTRGQVLRQLAEADATNRRLAGRNLRLGEHITALTEGDPEYAAQLERRITRLKKVGQRILAAYQTQYQQTLQDTTDPLTSITAWDRRARAHHAWKAPTDLELRPVDGAPARPTHPAVVLRRAMDRCQALETRLAAAEGRKAVRR